MPAELLQALDEQTKHNLYCLINNIYIYIYIHTHTHTHTHKRKNS